MAYTQEQLLEAYRKLPKDIQDAIFSVDVAEAIRAVGEKHKLMIDKIGEMADETGLVMLGFTHPSQFISRLADRLEIDKTVAKEIAEEINSKVFFPIRENLKKIHGMKEEAAEEVGPAAPTEIPELKETAIGPTAPETPFPPTPTLEEEIGAAAPAAPKEPSELKPEEKIPPPVISAMPIDLTQAQKIETAETTESLSGESHPIFEAKTKEEPLRSPIQISEKTGETPIKPQEVQKIDPYREPIS